MGFPGGYLLLRLLVHQRTAPRLGVHHVGSVNSRLQVVGRSDGAPLLGGQALRLLHHGIIEGVRFGPGHGDVHPAARRHPEGRVWDGHRQGLGVRRPGQHEALVGKISLEAVGEHRGIGEGLAGMRPGRLQIEDGHRCDVGHRLDELIPRIGVVVRPRGKNADAEGIVIAREHTKGLLHVLRCIPVHNSPRLPLQGPAPISRNQGGAVRPEVGRCSFHGRPGPKRRIHKHEADRLAGRAPHPSRVVSSMLDCRMQEARPHRLRQVIHSKDVPKIGRRGSRSGIYMGTGSRHRDEQRE